MPVAKASVAVIGAGLAGSEAALLLARQGVTVDLFEMRPVKMTPGHTTDLPAELICSNSLKSDQPDSIHGILKSELSLLESPLISCAQLCRVPAGKALAVNRQQFSEEVFKRINATGTIQIKRCEIEKPPQEYDRCIICAGPLISDSLSAWLGEAIGSQSLYFYDAIAPIVSADSIDMSVAFFANRWQESGSDYLNCPFTEDEYDQFFSAVTTAELFPLRDFEKPRFFEGCLPIEVLASRGYQTLSFGPLRPVGLSDPRTGVQPFAVCQLRKEGLSGDAYNIVGFQSRMTIPEQKRVFRLIPGLKNAEFLRFGSIHRNTYINSPVVLNSDLSMKNSPTIFIAGQLCGCEGYTESIATGHVAALFVLASLKGKRLNPPDGSTACGGLLRYITNTAQSTFVPSNCNASLFDPLPEARMKKNLSKKQKKVLYYERSLEHMAVFLKHLREEIRLS